MGWQQRIYGTGERQTKKVKVLVRNRLTSVDREYAWSIAQFVVTPNDARRLVEAEVGSLLQAEKAAKLNGSTMNCTNVWAIRGLDGLGRLHVLTYKGCEVKLFVRLQVVEEVYDVDMPDPGPAVKQELQEYMSVNLLDEKQQLVDPNLLKLVQDWKNKAEGAFQSVTSYQERLVEATDAVAGYKTIAEKVVEENGKLKLRLQALEDEQEKMQQRGKRREQEARLEGLRTALKTVLGILQALYRARTISDWAQSAYQTAVLALTALECEVIAPEVGVAFDPLLHNAVEVLELGEAEAGKIVEVSSIGLRHKQIVIKAADVAVAK